MAKGIDFVKHYKAHSDTLTGLALSVNGLQLCTAAAKDKALKFYDIRGFDMISMLNLSFAPGMVVWISRANVLGQKVAVADSASPTIFICKVNSDTGRAEEQRLSIHNNHVTAMAYNHLADVVISGDARGVLEYWSTSSLEFPSDSSISFRYKTDTDLYDIAKARASPTSIALSKDMTAFVVSASDCKYRVYNFSTGKLRRKYDESAKLVEKDQEDGTLEIDALDLGRRLAIERELQESKSAPACNAVFDESGNFILYSTLLGIKLVNIVTNRVPVNIGRKENSERFLGIALYQGTTSESTQMHMKLARKEEAGKIEPDPLVLVTAFKRKRFYFFSRREPEDASEESRDIFNEKPSADEQLVAVEAAGQGNIGKAAVIRTSFGDIHVSLFGDKCPRTVENFCTHSTTGYYDNLIFHRVIKSFMLQTGDPLGDGTGGESIWGGDFEDEIHRSLRHDRPFTLSMANSGPSTNGSQFFITTVATPWLDGKHTVFGRVTRGMDVVMQIEKVKCNKDDKPFDDITILNIDISN